MIDGFSRVTLVNLLLISGSPCLGWLALKVMGLPLIGALAVIQLVVFGVALVSPLVFVEQYVFERRRRMLLFGEWVWVLECGILIIMMASYNAPTSPAYFVAPLLQLAIGGVVLVATLIWLVYPERHALIWSDWTGRGVALVVSGFIVYGFIRNVT